ncbi:hypothetical protein O3G_MSEX004677 [Manduca sexta]|uniref:Mariner transposase n=1 Tax=Manduca sexta TaxID=7130 RepID=A0A922CHE4_MANSE|nr:hypothetical protein O3G_MSEX004677 [Manduca sexta]
MVMILLVKERVASGSSALKVVILLLKIGIAVAEKKLLNMMKLEALLNEDSCQTQEQLAKSLGVTQQAVSKRLEQLGMIQKQGYGVPYQLKPRDVERRLFACEQLLERQKRKGFLHRIGTGDEKWVHYDNPKRLTSWGLPGHTPTATPRQNIHGSKVMLCIWWDQLGVIYYELLKPSEKINGALY